MPRISVIITAHNRSEYLKGAIECVLNQDLSTEYYEMIVVKNFSDEVLDGYISQNGIKNYTVDAEPLGSKLETGIKASEGDILVFLEDDDLWEPERLRIILDTFNNEEVDFYHNSFLPVDKDGRKLSNFWRSNPEQPIMVKEPFSTVGDYNEWIGNSADINTSSMAIRKSLIDNKLNLLKTMNMVIDHFLFYTAITGNKPILIDSKILTKYRIHNSSSHTSGTYEEFLSSNGWRTKNALLGFKIMEDLSQNTPFKTIASCNVVNSRINAYLVDARENRPTLGEFYFSIRCSYVMKTRYTALYSLLAFVAILLPKWARHRYFRLKTSAVKKVGIN